MAKDGNGGGDIGCLAVILGLVLWVGFDRLGNRFESLEAAIRESGAPGAAAEPDVAALRAELEALRLENAELRARVEELERR